MGKPGRKQVADGTWTAYCWQTGLIGFGQTLPEGTLPIVRHGDEAQLRDTISGLARHAYPVSGLARQANQGDDLLVPGIPEAQGQDAHASHKRLEALNAFCDRARKALASD